MPRPLSKDHLAVLRAIARRQPSDTPPDELILEALAKAGYIASRRGRWAITPAGEGELDKRKAPPSSDPAPAA